MINIKKIKFIKQLFINSINKLRKGFTLTELIVTIAILAILGTIAMLSFQGYSKDARDTVRLSDINSIKSSLGFYYTVTSKYPEPTNGIDIQYNGLNIWKQGNFGDSTIQNVRVLNKKPIDPFSKNDYTYSVTKNRLEYELAGILESDLSSNNIVNITYALTGIKAYVDGNYNGLIVKTNTGETTYVLALPSIISSDINNNNIENIISNNKLVYKDYNNLPSSYINFIEGGTNDFYFNPNNLIVFSGSLNDLKDVNNQISFLKNIQASYSGAIIINNSQIIKNIVNTEVNSDKFKILACNVINFSLKYITKCEGLNYIVYYAINVLNIDINNLPGNKIEVIFQDDLGNFWFGTDEGIAFYDNNNWIIYNKENSSLINNHVTSISKDITGQYWFGTVNGISKFDGNSTWITYSQNILVDTHIQYIYSNTDGSVWIGTNGGISIYNSDSWDNYSKKSIGLTHDNITAIYKDHNNNVWFGTNSKGVDKYYISGGEGEISNYIPNNTSNGLPNKVITYISEDHLNNLWFGTKGGLGKLTGNSDIPSNWTSYTNLNTGGNLINNNITYIFEDNNNILWFGTKGGLSRYDGISSWRTYTTSNGLLGNNIYSIFQESNGVILILNDGGMNKIDASGNIIN